MSPRRPSYFKERVSADDLREAWSLLSPTDRLDGFKVIERTDAEEYFLGLPSLDQAELLHSLPMAEKRAWIRLLAPDDAADLIQESHPEDRESLLNLLDDKTRMEVTALLAYAEDVAGGLMNPQFMRLRPDMSVDEAIRYLRKQTGERVKSVYYTYVLDSEQHLLGVVSFRELLSAQPEKKDEEIMRRDLVTVHENVAQDEVSQIFKQYPFMAVPVIDDLGHMKGIITVDDIIDVVQEEATKDIQKMGGTEVLDAPYLKVNFFSMIRKRAGWLTILFFGELLTASAMSYYENEIAKAVVLALFIPLIISSGGNSGSQASTLVIRAMALGEVRLRDWWRVLFREIGSGLTLGLILGVIGLCRILYWPSSERLYGAHYVSIGFAVSASLVGVVLWGTLSGATLPLVLRRMGFDPAAASAPFVATLVDVTGLIIYFSMASLLLSGRLL